MLDVNLTDIDVVTSDNNIIFSGTINNNSDDDVSVNVKLYNDEDNLIGENTSENIFEVDFIFDDTLKLDDISTYSVEIIK